MGGGGAVRLTLVGSTRRLIPTSEMLESSFRMRGESAHHISQQELEAQPSPGHDFISRS